jgi:staphylococcal nuclease domain-containing protein 1
LIGKPVKVCFEYSRKQGKYQTDLCSVFFASGVSRTPNEDLGQLLVAAGLARCHRHKPSEDRSRNYNNLILAEDNAVRMAKGMFSKHAAKGGNPIIDFTIRERNPKPKPPAEDEAETKVEVKLGRDGKPRRPDANAHSRALAILHVLQRKGQMNGVVEHVFSGSKVKLYLPSENAYVLLMFAGIRSPEYNPNGDEKQLSNQVTKYVSSKLLQRSVKVDISSIDQRDNFIGGLWLQKSNFAVHLASKGFASVNNYSADKTSYKKQLDAAQTKAQDHKIGMWENWVKPEVTDSKPECFAFKKGECQRGSRCKFSHGDADGEPTEDEIKTRTNTKGEELINVKITEINDAANFFVTVVGDKAVATVNEGLAKFADELDLTADWDSSAVESGQIYAGKFDGDDGWYRVRVEGKKADGFLRVIFVDYGNRTELDANEIRPLSKELSSIPPLARQCSLAGLVSSFREEWKEAATEVFGQMCFAKEFLARVELKDKNNRLHLSLLTDDSKLSVNEQLVRAGHLRVHERPERGLKASLMDALKAGEAVAKASYLGVWEYGDVSDSDGEGVEKAFNGKAPRRKF